MSTVNTSFQVSFGDAASDADSHLSAEIDDRPEGGNGGKTSFVPGDTVYFLVYKSDNVSYATPVPSAGSIGGGGTTIVEKEDDLTFAGTKEANLPIPATSITSVTWLGKSLGGLTLTSPTTVTASAEGVAVARVKYKATANTHTLASPASVAGLTDFSIVIHILGTINA